MLLYSMIHLAGIRSVDSHGKATSNESITIENIQKAVAEYYKDAVVTQGGGYQAVRAALAAKRKPGQRGPGKRPPKEVINIRLSPAVVSAFRATGAGWQTRVDGALQDWLKQHKPKAIKVRRGGGET